MDVLAFHIRIPTLIFRALQFIDNYEFETVGECPDIQAHAALHRHLIGDPQTAMTHLGDVVLFIQYTIARFKVRLYFLEEFFD